MSFPHLTLPKPTYNTFVQGNNNTVDQMLWLCNLCVYRFNGLRTLNDYPGIHLTFPCLHDTSVFVLSFSEEIGMLFGWYEWFLFFCNEFLPYMVCWNKGGNRLFQAPGPSPHVLFMLLQSVITDRAWFSIVIWRVNAFLAGCGFCWR